MSKLISLNGKWKLYYHVEQGEMPSCPDDVKKLGWPVIDAVVPGNVELDLMRAGIEKDPFYAQNLYDYRKYEFYQWWFERDFDMPEELPAGDMILKAEGLDTYATVWINGRLAGETDNMLIEHSMDIGELIRPGEKNTISIRIKSSVNAVRNEEIPIHMKGGGGEHINEMVLVRKPPHSFGWDIAPRLLSAGIWKGIGIEAVKRTRIREVYYATVKADGNDAELLVKYRFATDETFIDGFSARIRGRCGEHTIQYERKTMFCSDEFRLQVKDAKLWWPKGYGDACLYDMSFELVHNGQVVDSRQERIGLRTVELETAYKPGDEGKFQIVVNHIPILAKGTNWVPLDALHSRDAERLQTAHGMLEDLGCNIVRCWGGNLYEDHAFFDLCDEKGMLVWQDFSLACGVYSQEEGFIRRLEKEAASVVKKLRNHPSLALWCGDNEVDMMYSVFGYTLPHARYNKLTREVLPGIAGYHDPFRAYIPSSPFIPEDMKGDHDVPEQHNWGPRDYFKSDFYKHTTASFISEIGYHGCPAVSSIRRFVSEEKLWPWQDNDDWDTHNTDYLKTERRRYNRNELMAKQIGNFFGEIPDSLERFVFASQITQAEAKKFFIEVVRTKKWRRTGVIWWNLLDCWPQFSDAIVDYYFVRKLAYYYIRRSQNPICIIMEELENWGHKVILCNDTRKTAEISYSIEDGDSGEVLCSGTVISQANTNAEICNLKSSYSCRKLYLLKWTEGSEMYANHFISGYPPFSLEQYEKWLKTIASLPQGFVPDETYK